MTRGVRDVAVVVPTYGRPRLLRATLDSLGALDRAPAEVIVVSDRSIDDRETDAVVSASGARLLYRPRPGVAAARNHGWRSSAADIVAFIDDDCVADAGWLGALEGGFDDPRVGLVQGRTKPAGPVGLTDRTLSIARETGLYESCNLAYRREALEGAGGFDESFGCHLLGRRRDLATGGGRPFGEDTDLAWRVKRAGWSSRFTADAVVSHHVFPGTEVDLLREEWRRRFFPYLVREVPELRDRLPGGRWFLRRQSPMAQLALLGGLTAASRQDPRPLALALPYLAWAARRNRRPGAFARQGVRDVVCSVGLVVGSVRERTLLL